MITDAVIIKLGGSIVTEKSKDGIIRKDRIEKLAKDIAAFSKTFPLIIVHGAGSCGHPEAEKWKINEGVTKKNAIGISETHNSVMNLNRTITDILQKSGINAVSVHPFDSCYADNGRIEKFNTDTIEKMLSLNIVPVLHGDVSMDRTKGACIISGDQIVQYLAKKLEIKKVGIATDVGGVIQNNSVVKIITRKNVSSINLKGSSNTDVTGGMLGKINELLILADSGIESHIFAPEKVAEFLSGKETNGTAVMRYVK